MVELHILWDKELLAVNIYVAVGDADTLSRKPHASFHIILTAVDRTRYHLTECLLVVEHIIAAMHGDE